MNSKRGNNTMKKSVDSNFIISGNNNEKCRFAKINLILVIFLILTISFMIMGVSAAGETKSLNSILKNCLNSVSNDAIIAASMQGGRIRNVDYLATDLIAVEYGLKAGKKVIVPLSTIRSEISDYIAENYAVCISEYSNSQATLSRKPTVSIKNSYVQISASVSNGVYFWKIPRKTSLNIKIPAALGQIYETAASVIIHKIKNPELDVSYLTGLKYDIIINSYDNGVVYSLIDDSSKMNDGSPLIFSFASDENSIDEDKNVECIALYEPVCGVDGITYSNECEMNKKEIEKAHDGAC